MPAITLKQVQEDPNRDDIFGVLNKYIQPDSAISASQAASTFSQSVKAQGEDFFWKFWKDVFSVAQQIPHDNPALDKLTLFVRELTLVPETDDKVWESCVWTDLPLLGAAIREYLDPPASAANDPTTTKAWVSFHAFVARLLHAGVSPGSETTAIWMLRAALEEEENDDNKSGSNSNTFDRSLMQAAVHIEYAGATLVQKLVLLQQQPSEPPQLDETQKRMTKGGALWKGESGLTADRWRFWGKRFREQAGKAAAGEETKELAVHAARLIEVWSQTQLQLSG